MRARWGWVACAVVGCGGANYDYAAHPSRYEEPQAAAVAAPAPEKALAPDSFAWTPPSLHGAASPSAPPPAAAPMPAPGGEAAAMEGMAEDIEFAAQTMTDAGRTSGSSRGLLQGTVGQVRAAPPVRVAQNGQAPARAQVAGEAPETATDAVDTSGPLLIYTAVIAMAVFEVEKTQEAIIEAVKAVGGYLQQRNDTSLVLRVPARRFEESLDGIEELGDVLSRNIQAADVSEQFRDIMIRIENAEAMRGRLEALLKKADDVQAALQIERELQRITELIETLKGRIRFLSDRIAFSTLTVQFRPHPTESVEHPDTFRLPFPWLDELGLSNLLRLQ